MKDFCRTRILIPQVKEFCEKINNNETSVANLSFYYLSKSKVYFIQTIIILVAKMRESET